MVETTTLDSGLPGECGVDQEVANFREQFEGRDGRSNFSFPFSRRHLFWAAWANLNIMTRLVFLVPLPFVRRWRRRIVANADSIGFVVRRCFQCSAGKS